MATLDEYSRLVSAIHAAALAPERWLDAMAAVNASMNATSSGLVCADSTSRIIKSAFISPEAEQAYRDYYRDVDYVLDAVERGPVAVIRGGDSLVALNTRSEFNHDWLRPYEMNDGLFVRLDEGPRATSFLVASPRRDEPFGTSEHLELFRALIPHLQQALRTQSHIEDLRHEAEDVVGAIDGMRHAVVVVGADGTVVHLNSAAEAMRARLDGPTVRSGRLVARTSAADAELQRAVAAALGTTDGGARSGTSLACPRISVGRPYVVHVMPFTGDGEQPRAMVVIVDLDHRPEPPMPLLCRVFGLTRAEADVALRVSRGEGLRPIADELSLSMATVKTHLQHVFDKTDTHRQAELVRLLLTLIP